MGCSFRAISGLLTCAFGAATGAAPVPEPAHWGFELLPKSLQKNPRLDLTVVTEFTPAGRKLPEVDVRNPAYFVSQSGGYRRTIDAATAERTLPPAAIDAFVRRSLATRGYFPATSVSPATLVLVYSWGVHARPPQDGTVSEDRMAANLIDRAALVGGERFRQQFVALLAEATAQADASVGSPTRHLVVDGEAVGPVLGPDQLEFMNPISRFREKNLKNELLLEQVGGDVYFVVISAYDHAALRRQQRVLLWRTHMTVSAEGVSQGDSLPTLIAAAAPYLGRETDEPVTLSPRSLPRGRVEVGPMSVEGADVAIPASPETTTRP